jgi:hypothetical protein
MRQYRKKYGQKKRVGKNENCAIQEGLFEGENWHKNRDYQVWSPDEGNGRKKQG